MKRFNITLDPRGAEVEGLQRKPLQAVDKRVAGGLQNGRPPTDPWASNTFATVCRRPSLLYLGAGYNAYTAVAQGHKIMKIKTKLASFRFNQLRTVQGLIKLGKGCNCQAVPTAQTLLHSLSLSLSLSLSTPPVSRAQTATGDC